MKPLNKILIFADDFLIDRFFQKIADFLSSFFGKSCYWTAKILYLFSIVSCLFCGILKTQNVMNSKIPEFSIIADTVGIFAVFCVFCFFLAMEEDKKERTIKFGETITMNSDRLRFSLIRTLYFLFFFAASAYLLSSTIFNRNEILIKIFCILYLGFFTSASYFSACIPFTGGKSKIKKWLESFSTSFEIKSLPSFSPSRK